MPTPRRPRPSPLRLRKSSICSIYLLCRHLIRCSVARCDVVEAFARLSVPFLKGRAHRILRADIRIALAGRGDDHTWFGPGGAQVPVMLPPVTSAMAMPCL